MNKRTGQDDEAMLVSSPSQSVKEGFSLIPAPIPLRTIAVRLYRSESERLNVELSMGNSEKV